MQQRWQDRVATDAIMRQGCVFTVVRARVCFETASLSVNRMVSLLQCWSDLLKAWVCTYCRASQAHRNTESFHALSGLSPFLGKEQQAGQQGPLGFYSVLYDPFFSQSFLFIPSALPIRVVVSLPV